MRFHEPLGARKPAARSATLAAEQEPQAEPERATHALQRPALAEMRVVSALEQGKIVGIAADEIRGRREALQILGAELAGAVRSAERFEGERPGARGVMATRLLELGGGGGLHRGPLHAWWGG